MFGKKKKKKENLVPVSNQTVVDMSNNYTQMKDEMGYLNLIMTRKKEISKNFYINLMNQQLDDKSYIRDKDLEKIINSGVKETYKMLSPDYKKFLVKKYFGSSQNLISYITEEFYVDLTSDAIVANQKKIEKNIMKQKTTQVMGMNVPSTEASQTKNLGNEEK